MIVGLNDLPPAIAGYIAELQDQVRLLSDRAAARASESFALRAEIEKLKKEAEDAKPE